MSAPARSALATARATGTRCRRCGLGDVRKYATAPEGRGLAFYCARCVPLRPIHSEAPLRRKATSR